MLEWHSGTTRAPRCPLCSGPSPPLPSHLHPAARPRPSWVAVRLPAVPPRNSGLSFPRLYPLSRGGGTEAQKYECGFKVLFGFTFYFLFLKTKNKIQTV